MQSAAASIPITPPRTPAAPATRARYVASKVARSDRGNDLAFTFLLLAMGVLFIRPSELFPALENWPFYEVLIAMCCAVALPILIDQGCTRWRDRPMNACVVWLLAAVVLSHMSHLFIWGARHSALSFSKLVVIYLLFVGLLNTNARFKKMLAYVTMYVVILTAMAVLQYHRLVNFPVLSPYPEPKSSSVLSEGDDGEILERLCSTGIFNDPNDFCLILLFGIMMSIYFMREGKRPMVRFSAMGALALFAYAIYLTHSRGGFIALLTSISMLVYSRFGWKRAILPLLILGPIMFFLFAGRQTQLSATATTSQQRLQLWSEALTTLRHVPIFGMGMDQFVESNGLVVHNSFLQVFVELGMVGGVLFLGLFVIAGSSLRRLGQYTSPGIDSALVRLRPYLLATLVAYITGYLSLSRSYSVSTYLLLGLIASYIRLATPRGLVHPKMDLRMLARLSVYGIAFVAFMYVVVRVFVRWS